MVIRTLKFRKRLFLLSVTTIYLIIGYHIYLNGIYAVTEIVPPSIVDEIFPPLKYFIRNLKRSYFTSQKYVNQLESQNQQQFTNKVKPNIKLLNSADIDIFEGEILILVTSHVKHVGRRNSMRNSWANQTRFIEHRNKYNNTSYKVYFMTGYLENSIHEAKLESSIFHDLLITNRTEHYWDLSRRVMYGFLWALEYCTFDYLLKADDDIFLNIPNLFKLIYTDPFMLQYKDRIFAGRIALRNSRPIRDPFSKWYVSREEWPLDRYPLFATGMGIILSKIILEKIRSHFDWINPFRLDDVYVGMLVNRANISGIGIRTIPSHIPKITDEFVASHQHSECRYIKQPIIFHKVGHPECMEKLTVKSIQNAVSEKAQRHFNSVIFVYFVAFTVAVVYICRKILKL